MVKNGDSVNVNYTGRLNDGTVFDSSEGREPLKFTVGSGMVIPGFDAGVIDMNVGDKKTITIPFVEAYGAQNDEMIFEFPKDQIPEDMPMEVGMQLNMSDQSGQVIPVSVISVNEDSVTLDANHPLAGKDLTFDLELVSID